MKHSSLKNIQLHDLKLKDNQYVVFSDGNLQRKDVWNEVQSSYSQKPEGLWYSCGRDWLDFLFLQDKDWKHKRLFSITHVYKIHLNRKYIFAINNNREFVNFHKKYAYDHSMSIDWHKLESDGWYGIQIKFLKPQHEDEKYGWYDEWDCSSGCIWNRKAITRIKLIKAWRAYWKSSDVSVSF